METLAEVGFQITQHRGRAGFAGFQDGSSNRRHKKEPLTLQAQSASSPRSAIHQKTSGEELQHRRESRRISVTQAAVSTWAEALKEPRTRPMFGLHRKRPHFRRLPAEVFGSVLINPRRIRALLLNPPPKQDRKQRGQVPVYHMTLWWCWLQRCSLKLSRRADTGFLLLAEVFLY